MHIGATIFLGVILAVFAVLDGFMLVSLLKPGDERNQIIVWKASSFTLGPGRSRREHPGCGWRTWSGRSPWCRIPWCSWKSPPLCILDPFLFYKRKLGG